MKIKITLRSGKELVIPTHATTIEGFMEEFTMLTSGVFGERTEYVRKYGDFVEIYTLFIRYSEIDMIEEYREG